MPHRSDSPRLTAGELEIVQMLWRTGEVTLSEAQRALGRPVGYTTVQTRLNRLVAKGVVARSKDRPAHYRVVVRPEEVSAGHLDLLLERVSNGRIVPLVAHLLKRQRLSPDEIAQLKRLIAESEQAAGANDTKPGGRKP
ncbi:MAG: BlaI/MecI/CopY family transcriptional regulator [Thermoguttaceae bacterium]|jgi:predicted transcriptional regulator